MDLKKWGSVLVCGCVLGAQSLTDDPVMRARSQRAQAQGIATKGCAITTPGAAYAIRYIRW